MSLISYYGLHAGLIRPKPKRPTKNYEDPFECINLKKDYLRKHWTREIILENKPEKATDQGVFMRDELVELGFMELVERFPETTYAPTDGEGAVIYMGWPQQEWIRITASYRFTERGINYMLMQLL